MIDLTHNRVAIAANLPDGKFSLPTVVSQRPHFGRLPVWISCLLPQQPRTDLVMPVAKNIGLYGDRVVDNSFNGKPPTVQFRFDVLNDNPASSLVRFRHYTSKPHCRQMQFPAVAF